MPIATQRGTMCMMTAAIIPFPLSLLNNSTHADTAASRKLISLASGFW
jgi:hypothetical protein